ncbi:MAG: SDR family NAD(P)-dependent oxidoreductase [Gammaproteobacteria bacterium]|nr:SDR family NAD(P)-dependent oxidoreductase [Gammaproteobacteria bacterium]
MSLAGKRIVVTGANGTLGRAVVIRAIELGAEVIGIDLAFNGTPALAREQRQTLDLTDKVATEQCFENLGGFDVLFNVAGGFAMGGSAYEVASPEWDAMFKINVATTQNAMHAAVPIFLKQNRGSIVNIGAMSAREGQANMSAYCAAKSVVMRLTESLAKELRTQGVNVNAVLPSIIDTPRNRQDMPDADHAKWVKPRDLANVVCFLGSDSAAAIHGALVPVVGLS